MMVLCSSCLPILVQPAKLPADTDAASDAHDRLASAKRCAANPLQVCVVVSALWGILYFGELQQRMALRLFCVASLVVLTGAASLKLAGQAGSP